MKNIGKILLLSFMTISMVAGCDLSDLKNLIKDSSDSSQNDNSDSSSDDANGYEGDKGDSSSANGGGNAGSDSSTNGGGSNNNNQAWSEAAANLMKEHLYGVVLPYTGSSASVVDYDAEYDMITITGGDVTLAGYQAALIADDYGLVGEDEESGAFAVEKAVATNEGQRFVYVYAEIDDEDGFSAQAFDPYYYSWPADQLEAFFEDWEATPFDVPTIDAENAYFLFEENEYNIWYYVLEMEDYISASLVAYDCSQSDFTTYYAKLETAGWEIKSTTEEGETYYSCVLNIENVGVARMDLYYAANYEAIALTIYVYMSAPDIIPGVTYESWPAIQIATMLGSSIKDTVPAYTGTNNGFQLLDDYYGMAAVVLVDEGTEAAGAADYVAALPDAGYVLDGVTTIGDDRYVSPNEEIYVSVYPAATPGTITIYFEPVESQGEEGEWPATKIANALENVTDVVPALEGAEYYGVYTNDEKVQIEVDFGDESVVSSKLSEYQTTLTTAGYTNAGADTYGDLHFTSPNNQLDVCAWKGSDIDYDGEIFVDITNKMFVKEEGWPTNKIAKLLANHGATDVLPALAGGDDYSAYETSYGDVQIDIVIDNVPAAIKQYQSILENAGFENIGADTYGDLHFTSPNGQYEVCAWDGGDIGYDGELIIDVLF